jgi:hypothetical protein
MSDSYIPAEDQAALVWMQAFSQNISADVTRYQLSVSDAQNIADAVDDYAAKLAITSNNSTRTPVAVASKDVSRNVAEQLCRQFAVQIKYNAGISDEDKIAVGVRPVNNSRDPIPVPPTSPLLNVLGATPGSHTIRYADTSTPDSAAKPFGAAMMQLWVAIANEPTTQESDAKFYGTFTKNPVAVGFSEEDDGKCATYFARWANRKGETGPWSLPVSMRIAA